MFKDSTEAQIVVSIETDGNAYFWNSGGLNNFILSDENWKKTAIEYSIKKAEIKPNSLLKVYVWNPKKQECLIDDFKITLIGFK